MIYHEINRLKFVFCVYNANETKLIENIFILKTDYFLNKSNTVTNLFIFSTNYSVFN